MKSQQILYMRTGDVARLFGISNRTVLNYVKQGKLPEPYFVGSARRWLCTDITQIYHNFLKNKGAFQNEKQQ